MSILPEVISAAQASRRKWLVPASISLAQYGVESAWGRYEPAGSLNGFGIQKLAGLPSVAAASHEYRSGVLVPVIEYFAKFASVADAFDEHAKLLATNPVYAPAMAVANDPKAFAHALLHRYATAPNYDTALINLMDEDNLYQYDVLLTPHAPSPVAVPSAPMAITSVAQLQGCLVKLGAALVVDGVFGVMSRRAVAAFQTAHGLAVDGDPGPETDAAILAALANAVA